MGTSRGVVNYHIKNKEEILRAALQSAVKDASAATDQIVAESRDLGGITELVVGLAARAGSDWWQVYIAFLAEATHDDFAKRMIQETDWTFRRNLARALGEARGAVVLALMKGLALQRVVDKAFDVEKALAATSELLALWSSDGP